LVAWRRTLAPPASHSKSGALKRSSAITARGAELLAYPEAAPLLLQQFHDAPGVRLTVGSPSVSLTATTIADLIVIVAFRPRLSSAACPQAEFGPAQIGRANGVASVKSRTKPHEFTHVCRPWISGLCRPQVPGIKAQVLFLKRAWERVINGAGAVGTLPQFGRGRDTELYVRGCARAPEVLRRGRSCECLHRPSEPAPAPP
jgi:hypothetical protein